MQNQSVKFLVEAAQFCDMEAAAVQFKSQDGVATPEAVRLIPAVIRLIIEEMSEMSQEQAASYLDELEAVANGMEDLQTSHDGSSEIVF